MSQQHKQLRAYNDSPNIGNHNYIDVKQQVNIRHSELAVHKDNLLGRVNELSGQINVLKLENGRLQSKVSVLQSEIDNMRLNQSKEGCFLIEMEHLRDDNARLIRLLKESGNHSYIYDSDAECGLRYLKEVGVMSEQPKLASKLIHESLLWVPHKAYEFAQQFKLKYQDQDMLSDEQIQLLLFELNKVWSIRQQSQLDHVKNQHNRDKGSWKRKNELNYNEHMMQQKIIQLETQLKTLQRENIQQHGNRPERNSNSLIPQRQRVQSQKENSREIKKRDVMISELSNYPKTMGNVKCEKQCFIDGAVWICNKLKAQLRDSKEIQVIEQNMSEIVGMYRNI